MLLYPAIDLLKTKVDSKYTLAIMTSKRARDIVDGKPVLTIAENDNPLSIATAEVADDLISYKYPSHDEEADVYEEEAAAEADAGEGGEEPAEAVSEEADAEPAEASV